MVVENGYKLCKMKSIYREKLVLKNHFLKEKWFRVETFFL